MARGLGFLAALAIAGCVGGGASHDIPQRRALITEALPPMKVFVAPASAHPVRSNSEIARDFLDLSFQMESGRTLDVMSRFEGPITLRMIGTAPASVETDLNALLGRLKAEAGLTITRAGSDEPAAITVEFLPRRQMQKLVPQAACFVMPAVSSWQEFRRYRNDARVDWAGLTQRDHVAVFVPNDTSPQEMRDCLHEEIAQAIGPLNDLYRLPDSVFNDDNFHTVLTGFDMLMLRLYYAPELRSGMSREAVATLLPALLQRENPGGGPVGAIGQASPTDAWSRAIETALGPSSPARQRRAAADQALAIASRAGWTDCRRAFSHFAVGRLALADDGERALNELTQAARYYQSLPGTEIHLAHVDMQIAAYALSTGQASMALELANRNLIPVSRAENAALLATLLMIKSEALELLDRPAEAKAVRLDSLGWARYGFGSDEQVRARMSEIAVLSPRRGRAVTE